MYETVHIYQYSNVMIQICMVSKEYLILHASTETYTCMHAFCMHNACLPNMRLQMAFLAILMFWKDPRMWILLH